jgi:hypothetical protein
MPEIPSFRIDAFSMHISFVPAAATAVGAAVYSTEAGTADPHGVLDSYLKAKHGD